MLEKLSMQFAEIVRRAEFGLVFVVFQEQYAEIIIAHVGGETISYNAINARIGFGVENIDFQYFNQGQTAAGAGFVNIHFYGNDIEFDRVAVPFGIVPVRQGIEAIVDHP